MTKLNIQDISVKKITPDPNQPRKYFNAAKMKTLISSIKQYGIKQPLIVQEIGKEQYLISVGERRYRAAVQLDMDTVPCLIEKAQNETERLIEQFNVEEQHESWTPTEKAVAITSLSEKMGLNLQDTCRLLNVSKGEQDRYIAFAQLVDKASWLKNEIPLDMAKGIKSLKALTKRLTEEVFEEQFTRADEKKMEHRVIELIKNGDITYTGQLARIKDSFTKDPKTIKTFMETKVTPDKLFMDSKAKGAYHLRNAYIHAGWVNTHGAAFAKLRDVKMTPEQVSVFKRCKAACEALVDIAE